jgi:hypothetical protein
MLDSKGKPEFHLRHGSIECEYGRPDDRQRLEPIGCVVLCPGRELVFRRTTNDKRCADGARFRTLLWPERGRDGGRLFPLWGRPPQAGSRPSVKKPGQVFNPHPGKIPAVREGPAGSFAHYRERRAGSFSPRYVSTRGNPWQRRLVLTLFSIRRTVWLQASLGGGLRRRGRSRANVVCKNAEPSGRSRRRRGTARAAATRCAESVDVVACRQGDTARRRLSQCGRHCRRAQHPGRSKQAGRAWSRRRPPPQRY